MTINPDITLSDLVSHDPGRARVLERFGLNYCCGGQESLESACREQGLDPAEVLTAVEAAPPSQRIDWHGASLEDIAAHIVDEHHAYLWRELPRLSVLFAKTTRAHGDAHPELFALSKAFDQLCAGLEPHLRDEEQTLFPDITAAEAGMSPSSPPGDSIGVRQAEHRAVGELLARLRTLSDGYTTPDDGCLTYRALMSGLEDLEHSLHVHINLESNELFPRALQLDDPAPTAPHHSGDQP